ncbi:MULTISPECIES: snapalysin [Streptomyces]|uniref:Extracellular small neutral protease n=1 Tax=Streptomyces lasiicapitis TaxID=1923961 RepID=A0ABQ2LTE5_9ACTN|nr:MULTISPECIES: snapalysin [Streptomyces]QIB44626.1 snapalysin [Streptomyces aureoverticillatus]GGO43000.1 extracellular small neutral protease [Streptomyces lasiicapitis]
MHKRYLSVAAALGLAVAALGTTAATAVDSPRAGADSASSVSTAASVAKYNGSGEEAAANKAFFEAVVKAVAEKRAANPGAKAVTVTYNASQAPTFRQQIASSTSIWNAAVTNVKLQSGTSGASFSYREGNDPRGSYASTDGHGRGYIFLDYRQNQQYNSTRVTAHETGHVLGLPDNYRGPCSELMSGGGPGTSCQNAQPNAAERARVNQLWANGLAKAIKQVQK